MFTPYISKRFKVSDLDDIQIIDLKKEDNTDELMTVLSIPSGISDAEKINKKYRLIIDELELVKISNLEAYDKIWDIWKEGWS